MFDLDWKAPWLKGFERHGQEVMVLWSSFKSLARALNHHAEKENCFLDSKVHLTPLNEPSLVLSTESGSQSACKGAMKGSIKGSIKGTPFFVAQEALPPGEAYESFIYRTHQVPTRDNLHDFFNALCWFRFPLTKSYLNEQQALAIEALGHVHARGALRDALTLLDENACFVWCEHPLWERLKSHDWLDAFWLERESWSQVRVELFGHALLEKLCAPYKGITAHALRALPLRPIVPIVPIVPNAPHGPNGLNGSNALFMDLTHTHPSPDPLKFADQQLDQAMLDTLRSMPLNKKPFQALPVLGVPGWFRGNEDRSFYEDADVFRPQRKKAQASGDVGA